MRNEYFRKYMSERYYKRRNQAFEILGNKCCQCGSTEKLEIDHIEWKYKEISLNKFWNCSNSKFLEELVKCQILCKSCHVEKSKIDVVEIRTGFKEQPHGTNWRYVKYKCRCEECLKFKPISTNKRKKKTLDDYSCGIRAKYIKGCRCEKCKAANNIYQKELNIKLRQLKNHN